MISLKKKDFLKLPRIIVLSKLSKKYFTKHPTKVKILINKDSALFYNNKKFYKEEYDGL